MKYCPYISILYSIPSKSALGDRQKPVKIRACCRWWPITERLHSARGSGRPSTIHLVAPMRCALRWNRVWYILCKVIKSCITKKVKMSYNYYDIFNIFNIDLISVYYYIYIRNNNLICKFK